MQCPFCHSTIKISEAFLPGGNQKKRGDSDAEDEEEEDNMHSLN
jgi:1,4-dihydroxy-2-naphthoyl-CoA synthase